MLPPKLPKKPKRETRWRSPAHLTFIRSFRCAFPGCSGMPIEAAHVRLGSGAGMGQRPDDHRVVPLCKHHHTSQHAQGEATFWHTYEIASGQTVDQLLDALCNASPKAAEIRANKRERNLG